MAFTIAGVDVFTAPPLTCQVTVADTVLIGVVSSFSNVDVALTPPPIGLRVSVVGPQKLAEGVGVAVGGKAVAVGGIGVAVAAGVFVACGVGVA